MQRETGSRPSIVWPGFGLVMGAAIGASVGLHFLDTPALGVAIGAGVGLVPGATIGRAQRR